MRVNRSAPIPAPPRVPAEGPGRLDGLQALRAFAALSVVVFHAGRYVADRLPEAMWRWGEFGVDVFFVLSGFVMLWATRPGTGTWPFLLRRVARIAPMYWLVTLAMALAVWRRPDLFHAAVLDPAHLGKSLAFIPHFHPGVPGEVWPFFVPGWTLNYEMYFYGLFAATLPWIVRPGPRVLAIVALLAMGVVLAHGVAALDAPALAVFLRQPLVFEFTLGMALALAYRHGLRLPRSLAVAVAGAGFGLLVAVAVADFRLISAGVPAAAMVFAMVSFPRLRSAAGRAMTRLGDASYTLYLIQPFAIGALWLLWQAVPLERGVAEACGFIGACLIACAGAAGPIHRWIEQPLTHAATRMLTAPSRSPAAA